MENLKAWFSTPETIQWSLDQAVAIADHFIASGPLVITVGEGRKKREERSASYIGSETQYPMAVLVNGGSAFEIVSGAIKNLDRGIVVGQKLLGKVRASSL